jgi:hypothetical protein
MPHAPPPKYMQRVTVDCAAAGRSAMNIQKMPTQITVIRIRLRVVFIFLFPLFAATMV